MRTNILSLLLGTVLMGIAVVSCNDDDTYADRRDREQKQITSFLETGVKVLSDEADSLYLLNIPGNIKVISTDEFYRNDSTTDVSKNEYVYFSDTGVYMQIVRKGTGKKIEDGERATVVCRYIEYGIASDTILSSNRSIYTETSPEIMECSNNLGIYSAVFTSGIMKRVYNSSNVPSGWLEPMPYINIGRQSAEGVALVRLIVPSTRGTETAYSNVYPCFYEISYQRGR